MSEERVGRDARVLALLSVRLPGPKGEAAAPLGVAEWCRIGGRLRQAGLSRPGELLAVGPRFWPAVGLADEDVVRLRGLLDRGDALDRELERLAGLGIRLVTSVEPGYPARLRERLRGLAPPVLFGAGEWALLERPGLAIVGSRSIDEAAAAFTRAIATRCARDGLMVVTGGARGVDQIAMQAALEAGGAVLGVPAGDLERSVGETDTRQWLEEGRLLLLSPLHPRAGFSVAHAMARNKIVYALAEYGLVVSSAAGQGGTWAGAREVLRHGWVPLFVRDDPSSPEGNRELLRPAARPFPPLEALGTEALGTWLARQVAPPAEAPPPAVSAMVEGPQDLFPLVWPYLAGFLSISRSPAEVATAFHLTPEQASAWLRRAKAEGKVGKVKGRSLRYRSQAAPASRQLRLLERGESYRVAGSAHRESEAGLHGGWPGVGIL